MEQIIQFISELFISDGIIIVLGSFVIGEILKGFDNIPNNVIPLIGGIIGAILGCVIPDIFVGKDIVTSGVLGLALGWAATGGYETIRNIKEGL